MKQRTKALSVLGAAALAVAVPVSGIFTSSQSDVERALVYLDEIHHAEEVVTAQAETIHRWELELRTLIEAPVHPPTDPTDPIHPPVEPPIHPPDPVEPPTHPTDPLPPTDPTDPPTDPTDPPVAPTPGEYLSVSRDDIIWTFASPVSAVPTVTGDWLVPAGTIVVEITPGFRSIPREMSGSMVNPGVVRNTSTTNALDHGYDEAAYAQYDDGYYKRRLNVGRSIALGEPYVMRAGDALVSVISYEEAGRRSQIWKAAVLYAVATLPTEAVFRPGIAPEASNELVPAAQVDFSKLQSMTMLSDGPDVESVIDGVVRLFLDHGYEWLPRYLRPEFNMDNYGREFSHRAGRATLIANCDIPTEQKQRLVYALVQRGIDYHGWAQSAKANDHARDWMRGGGGHLQGRKWLVLFAGLMLDDASMTAMGGDLPTSGIEWQEDDQTFTVEVARSYQGYTVGMIGMAEWGINHRSKPDRDCVNWVSEPPWPPIGEGVGASQGVKQNVKYRRCCTTYSQHAQTAAALLMGAEDEWGHPAYFAYQARYINTEKDVASLAYDPWTLRMLRATNLLPGLN